MPRSSVESRGHHRRSTTGAQRQKQRLVLADSSERSVECTVFLRGDEPLAVEIGQVVQVRATIGKEYQPDVESSRISANRGVRE